MWCWVVSGHVMQRSRVSVNYFPRKIGAIESGRTPPWRNNADFAASSSHSPSIDFCWSQVIGSLTVSLTLWSAIDVEDAEVMSCKVSVEMEETYKTESRFPTVVSWLYRTGTYLSPLISPVTLNLKLSQLNLIHRMPQICAHYLYCATLAQLLLCMTVTCSRHSRTCNRYRQPSLDQKSPRCQMKVPTRL